MTLDKKLVLETIGRVDTTNILSPKEIDKLVSDLMDFTGDMNEWEYDFIMDASVRCGQRASFTKKQIETLKKMERKYL